MEPYPHLLNPLDLGFTTAAQPRADGQHAHRLEDGRAPPPWPPTSPSAREGRRGPDRHRRLSRPTSPAGPSPLPALTTSGAARRHRQVTDAVHAEGGKIALQILHTGRYGYHPLCVAPSRIQSPISPFTPV
jgi:2,4-dienoyl-CoA reductase (NADPH2)